MNELQGKRDGCGEPKEGLKVKGDLIGVLAVRSENRGKFTQCFVGWSCCIFRMTLDVRTRRVYWFDLGKQGKTLGGMSPDVCS